MPGQLPYFTLSLPAWEVKIQIVKATPNIWDVLILQGTTYHTKVSVFPRQFIISSLKFSKRCLVSTSWLNIIKTSMLKRKVGLKFLQPCRMSFHDISLPIYLFWSHIRFYREMLQTLFSQHSKPIISKGHSKKVFWFFHQIFFLAFNSRDMTILWVLNLCSRSSPTKLRKRIFEKMSQKIFFDTWSGLASPKL